MEKALKEQTSVLRELVIRVESVAVATPPASVSRNLQSSGETSKTSANATKKSETRSHKVLQGLLETLEARVTKLDAMVSPKGKCFRVTFQVQAE